jgi:hypothetical protein
LLAGHEVDVAFGGASSFRGFIDVALHWVGPVDFLKFKRALSPARNFLEDISHQTRPKIDANGPSLLMGSTN